MTARALSIQPPWSWAITDLGKRCENRDWPSTQGYLGEIFIHASKTFRPMEELEYCVTVEELSVAMRAKRLGLMPQGAIVAVADLVNRATVEGARRLLGPDQHRWIQGPLCLLLDNVRKLAEPVPCRGMLGLWPVPAGVERRVREQLQGMPRAETLRR